MPADRWQVLVSSGCRLGMSADKPGGYGEVRGWCLVHVRGQQERATGKGEIGDFVGEVRCC